MKDLLDEIVSLTGAEKVVREEHVQTLWSDYGQIKRVTLAGGAYPSVIVKHIKFPDQYDHPKGWNTSRSHERKRKSYQVEQRWYQDYAALTNENCKVPESYHLMEDHGELLMIMEDLQVAGYHPLDPEEGLSMAQVRACLSWLANFHATFMGTAPEGLWPTGTYWHLDTRPDELKKMRNISLKQVAKSIDQQLNNARYQTLVHGDAKLANFCWSDSEKVAAVDFQYVGMGCGMKDVAYFLSSCLGEQACEKFESHLLDHYFNELEKALSDSIDFVSLKEEWLLLYPFAWADFYRFLDGWSPGHWKMHDYSKRMTDQVIGKLLMAR